VLAAAIHGDANTIVTLNLKDFPALRLRPFNIIAEHPDVFVTNLIKLAPENCLTALRNQVFRLRNPPKTIDEVLVILERCGLPHSVALLKKML